MSDIEIEIDGKKLTAKPNQTVIQVADEAGIYIPRFCYHKHLSIAANCRMCLVDVEKSPKALPACATPVMPGMKVFTRSQKTIDAQRAVMQFLLINHPLDCPICDQGGECELQDLAMGYGSSHSDYDECKRSIADENLGPLISTDMTRCIYCTRCVRFGDEVAGMREMGGTYRGGHTEIGTFVKHAIQSEVSGNIIDLCPVGALTSKPYRFTARAWELQQSPGISPHDCVGSNLHVHTRYGEVMRVVSRENPAINDTWIADRDRFSYTGLYHHDRLKHPIAKIHGEWQVVEWQHALELAAAGLKEVAAQDGADNLGALASPSSTLEEFYLLQKIMRGLGSHHIDHRLRQRDMRDQAAMPLFPGLSMPIAELDQCDVIVLIGSNIQKEQPSLALRVRKAALKGASVIALNPMDYRFNFPLSAKKIAAPHLLPHAIAAVTNALQATYDGVAADEPAYTIAQQLRGKQKICILLGALALHDEQASAIRAMTLKLASLTNAAVGMLTDGANSAGGWMAGAIPHRYAGGTQINEPGLSAYGMLEKMRKGYLLLNVDPELDCANPAQAIAAVKQAKFVVAISQYRNTVLDEYADVILPMAAFTESSGTYINAAGEWQSVTGMAKAYESARPAWKILRVLGNFLALQGFDYENSEEIKQEVKAAIEAAGELKVKAPHLDASVLMQKSARLTRIGEVPIYAVDSLVRHAQPLQETQAVMEGDVDVVRLHPATAKKMNLPDGSRVRVKQQGRTVDLPLVWDTRVAEDAAWIAGGIPAAAGLGELFGDVEISLC